MNFLSMLSRVSEKARYIWSVEKTNSNPYDRNQFTCLSNSATGKLANTSPRCNVLFPSCLGRLEAYYLPSLGAGSSSDRSSLCLVWTLSLFKIIKAFSATLAKTSTI